MSEAGGESPRDAGGGEPPPQSEPPLQQSERDDAEGAAAEEDEGMVNSAADDGGDGLVEGTADGAADGGGGLAGGAAAEPEPDELVEGTAVDAPAADEADAALPADEVSAALAAADVAARHRSALQASGAAACAASCLAAATAFATSPHCFALRWRAVQERLSSARGLGYGRSTQYALVAHAQAAGAAADADALTLTLSAGGVRPAKVTPGEPGAAVRRREAAAPATHALTDTRRASWRDVYARCAKCGRAPGAGLVMTPAGLCTACVDYHRRRLQQLQVCDSELYVVGQGVAARERISFVETGVVVQRGALGTVTRVPGRDPESVAEVQFGGVVFDAKPWHVRPIAARVAPASPPARGRSPAPTDGWVVCPHRAEGCKWAGAAHDVVHHTTRECAHKVRGPRQSHVLLPDPQRRQSSAACSVASSPPPTLPTPASRRASTAQPDHPTPPRVDRSVGGGTLWSLRDPPRRERDRGRFLFREQD